MINKIMKVNLVKIDVEGIKQDPRFDDLALVPFKLSGYPDSRWVDIFKRVYRAYSHSKKRQFEAVKGTQETGEIILRIGVGDDPQVYYDIVKEVIEATNKEVDTINLQTVAQEKEQEEEEKTRRVKIAQLKEKATKVKT